MTILSKEFAVPIIKKCTGASVNAYLVLRQGNQILFNLRKNTGYCDGMWSLIAGHVEDGESATAGMVREAREEIGIEITPSQLNVVHIMHRKTDRLNVDIFFDCQGWEGIPKNMEPEKSEALEFFSLHALPSNLVDHIQVALKYIVEWNIYSEFGWD